MHYIEIPKPQHSFFLCFTNYELQCIRFFKNVPLPRGRFGECSVRELLTIFRAPTVHCESSAAAAAAVARRPPHHRTTAPSAAPVRRPVVTVRRRRPRRPRPPYDSMARRGVIVESAKAPLVSRVPFRWVARFLRCHAVVIPVRRRIVTVPPS